MTIEENKALARRFYQQVFNEKNLAAIDDLITQDGFDHGLPPGFPQGPAGVRQFIGMYLAAFPDLHVTIEDIIAQDDRVVLRLMYRGTHQGELMGIPPTGKPVTVTAIEILRVVGDKTVEHWASIDQLGMLQQLGVIPTPGQDG